MKQRYLMRSTLGLCCVLACTGLPAQTPDLAPGAGSPATGGAVPLETIQEPDLSGMEPVVAEQLVEARAALQALDGRRVSAADLAGVYGDLGKVYLAYELYPQAETALSNAKRLEPEGFPWIYYLAYLYQQSGQLPAAAEHYAAAKALEPDSALVRIRLGDLLLQQGEIAAAKREFLEASYLQPGATAILLRLGEVALGEQRFTLAITYLSAALEREPAADRLHYLLGMAYRGLGQEEAARDHLAASGPIGIEPPDSWIDELRESVRGERLYLLRGKLAYNVERYEEAAEAFRRAVAANENSARGRVNLGTALAKLQRYGEAMEQYRAALLIEPGNLTAAYNLGELLLYGGDPAQAIPYLETVAQAASGDAEAHLALARAYTRQGRIEEALAEYRATARTDPSAVDAWIEGAQLTLDQGQEAEALAVLEQAHAKLPGNNRIAHALAWLLAAAPARELRDGPRALELARAVQQAAPTPGHTATLAMAHAETGDCAQAAEWQQRALEAAARQGGVSEAYTARLRRILEHYRDQADCRAP